MKDEKPVREIIVNEKNVNPEVLRIALENLERYRKAMEELSKIESEEQGEEDEK